MCEYLWRREERLAAKRENREPKYFDQLLKDVAKISGWDEVEL